jgi:hypothetical protein
VRVFLFALLVFGFASCSSGDKAEKPFNELCPVMGVKKSIRKSRRYPMRARLTAFAAAVATRSLPLTQQNMLQTLVQTARCL